VLDARLKEGVMDSSSLSLPIRIAFCKGESFAHEVLIHNCIKRSLLVQLINFGRRKEFLDHLWVLHEQSDDSSVHHRYNGVICGIEGLILINFFK